LQAEGGASRQTWTVNSGALPPGLSFNPSKRAITGTPTRGGTFSFTVTVTDSSGATASKTFSLQVFEQPLDQYGGLINRPSPHGATGFFRVEKANGRWTFVTPAGNDFYLLSVYHGDGGSVNSTILKSKYGGSLPAWGTQRNRKMLAWGFNTIGEYASQTGLPVDVWGCRGCASPVKLPFILIMNAIQDAMFNPRSLSLREAVKNVMGGIPKSSYTGWRAPLVDAYDPKFVTAYQREVAYWTKAISNDGQGFAPTPWLLGITTDDADSLFGFKSGGSGPVTNYPHDGFLIATTNFSYSGYTDPQLHSKYAWISYLQAKYATVSALNTAWGTGGFYTSFGDAGGFGAGTGVIDEDGRHTAWMGNDPFTLDGTHNNFGSSCSNCLAASAGVKADLDAFLYQFAKQYAQVAVAAIRAVDTNHLIFGPAALNNYGVKARDQVLQGLSDGGIEVFQFNYDPGCSTTGPSCPRSGSGMGDNNASYNLIGKPAYIWYSVNGQADSSMSAYPAAYGAPDFGTQSARASHYATVDLPAFLNAQGANGDYYVLGIDWWELIDNPGEHMNWGLMTGNDNAYDGREAIIAPGADSWGYPTGGEAANYGDFLDTVLSENLTVLRTIAGLP
jgi:hypothetical protein